MRQVFPFPRAALFRHRSCITRVLVLLIHSFMLFPDNNHKKNTQHTRTRNNNEEPEPTSTWFTCKTRAEVTVLVGRRRKTMPHILALSHHGITALSVSRRR